MQKNPSMMRRFISYYKKYTFLFFADLFCALALAAIELVYPSLTTTMIDIYIPHGMLQEILRSGAFLLGLYLIMSACNYFVNYWGHLVGVRMEADMRSDFFNHLQQMPFKFFDRNRTGQLMSRIVNDLNLVTELAHHGPEDLFISVVMFVGSFVVLVQKQWLLTVILYFGIIPIMVIFAVSQRRKMGAAFRQVQQRTADINAQIENSLSGIRVSKSYTNEDYEVSRFEEGNGRFRNAKKLSYFRMATFMTGMGFMTSVLNLSVLMLGGIFAVRGVITIGELTGFLLYVNLVLQPINKLINFTQQFEQGMSGFSRFHEIMNEKPDILDGALALDNVEGRIAFKDVSFSYDEDERVLAHINLEVQPGNTVALVGPSGGGKTTLCHLIPRFYDIDEGAITIDGHNIKDFTLHSLRSQIGHVQQDVFLFTGTIGENILYGKPDASYEAMVAAAKQADIHEFVASLPEGYDTWVGEKGVRLSGGQKQRISIARVFLKNPPILLLDEATSALDNETEIKIQAALESLSRGRTTLVIAHRLSTIRNADVILVMTAQGIVEQGSHEALYTKEDGIYRRLYDAQFRFEQDKSDIFFLFFLLYTLIKGMIEDGEDDLSKAH